jgi:alginate O-acetyltransferase complex protein AlgI
VLWLNIALNIGLLCAFKYGNEFFEAYNWLARQFHPSHETRTIKVLLPVGLSFFTFQSLSYTIDVYRRKLTPASSPLDLALFVAFFPVLLSGPLLRAGNFLPQCAEPRRVTLDHVGMGAAFVTLGLFMKITLADHILSPVVRQAYDPGVHPDALTAWIGTIAFAGQDYCDFAGYTTCAVGLGLCLGFTLPDNFRAPFASVGFRDLWQRWHITLVAWMRDYVFNSLGGIYKGYRRAAINVMIVFLLIGLWHGAAMTYVIFGLLHGSYLVVETILQRSPLRRLQIWDGVPGIALLWLATMFLCLIAFVFYRASTVGQSLELLRVMFGLSHASDSFALPSYDLLITIVVMEILVISHWLRRNIELRDLILRSPWWIISLCLTAMIFALILSRGQSQEFLYFNY